jgi:hypothetical protein
MLVLWGLGAALSGKECLARYKLLVGTWPSIEIIPKQRSLVITLKTLPWRNVTSNETCRRSRQQCQAQPPNPHQPSRRRLEATTRVCLCFRRNLRRGVHHLTPDVDVRLIHLYSARKPGTTISGVGRVHGFEHWPVLADSPGLLYCTTSRRTCAVRALLSVHTVDKRVKARLGYTHPLTSIFILYTS